jgi:hypothetical protein
MLQDGFPTARAGEKIVAHWEDKIFAGAGEIFSRFSREHIGLSAGMDMLVEYCRKNIPDAADWEDLPELDFEADYDRLTCWMAQLLEKEPPGKEINGLWFGLFNPGTEAESCQLYLAGSRRFGPRKPDWHCQPEYWPEGRYAGSQVIPAVSRAAGFWGDAVLCHGYVCLVLARWCRSPWRAVLLGKTAERAIAFGHDEGDVYLVEILKKNDASGSARPSS